MNIGLVNMIAALGLLFISAMVAYFDWEQWKLAEKNRRRGFAMTRGVISPSKAY